MWVLECDGDAFQGKKMWLPPKKKYIFGRTASTGTHVINNKTISRKHLVLEVGSADDCRHAHTRTILTLEDLDTKIGTLVNSEQIRGKTHTVTKGENVVTLGRYEHPFRITWVPINLTVPFTAKEVAKTDPYPALYEQLGPFDIKVLSEYDRTYTTHLVAKKRNTSRGLQALINGAYIVHYDSYINALVAACSPPANGSKTQSPLEDDWEANFPDPLQYLPPRGDEPTQRDNTAYSLNTQRRNMFEGYTFVFYDTQQHENLLAPILEGGGKAVIYPFKPRETHVDEFVAYVKETAGETGLGSFEDGSVGKGVVVVRFHPRKGDATTMKWYIIFNRAVALHLDFRLVEQSEFLDAILGADASSLRSPLDFVQSGVVAPPPSAGTAMGSQAFRSSPPSQHPASTSAEMAPPEHARKGRVRRQPTRFDKIDQSFGGISYDSAPAESMAVDSIPAVESQGLFVSQDSNPSDMGRESSEAPETQRGARKRNTPPVEYEDGHDIMSAAAPAAQAFKKRKLAEENARRQRGESTPPPPVATAKAAAKVKTKPARKEIDVKEALAQRQKEAKAEELARSEREAPKVTLNGMDINAMRNLAIIEEMPVGRSAPPRRAAVPADESGRWDDSWNGRKNFKRFRPQGMDRGPRIHRVIVALEEVKKKDFGIGDDHWPEVESQRKKNKGKDTQDIQSQPSVTDKGRAGAAQVLDSDDEDGFAFANNHDNTRMASSDAELPEVPKSAARARKGAKLADKTNESQNMPSQRGTKRAADATIKKPVPAKKAKPAPVVEVSDDDSDDDELKFKFGRRK